MTIRTLSLHMQTPHATLFQSDDVTMVIVPGAEGDLGVMAGHLPVLTTLRAGTVEVRQGDSCVFSMVIHAHHEAVVHIEKTRVSIMLNYFCPLENYSPYTYSKDIFDRAKLYQNLRIESRTFGDYRIQREVLLNMTRDQYSQYGTYVHHHKNPTLTPQCIGKV